MTDKVGIAKKVYGRKGRPKFSSLECMLHFQISILPKLTLSRIWNILSEVVFYLHRCHSSYVNIILFLHRTSSRRILSHGRKVKLPLK